MMSSITAWACSATPSIAVLTSRVTGIVVGSIVSHLGAVLLGHQGCGLGGRQQELGAGGRAHRLAVERHAEPLDGRRHRRLACRSAWAAAPSSAAGRGAPDRGRTAAFRPSRPVGLSGIAYSAGGTLLACAPVDDDEPGRDEPERREDLPAERLAEQQPAEQHPEGGRQEGEARKARRRIAPHQPEPQNIGDRRRHRQPGTGKRRRQAARRRATPVPRTAARAGPSARTPRAGRAGSSPPAPRQAACP